MLGTPFCQRGNHEGDSCNQGIHVAPSQTTVVCHANRAWEGRGPMRGSRGSPLPRMAHKESLLRACWQIVVRGSERGNGDLKGDARRRCR